MKTPSNVTKLETRSSTANSSSTSPKCLTELGTPCSPAWDADWIATVEATEIELGKRICGARTLSGKPCLLESNHENGRCRYHGGFNLTGAQPGNRNAVIHGLYARCIQTCGSHCPMWRSCPCAGDDVQKLDPKDRPQCPYEKAHYETAVTDNLARLNVPIDCDTRKRHCAHELAMAQVMMMRAASAMSVNDLCDTHVKISKNSQSETRKVGAYTEAFLRLSSEFRRLYTLFKKEQPDYPKMEARKEQIRRAQHDTSLLEDDQEKIEPQYTSLGWNANEQIKIALGWVERRCPDQAKAFIAHANALDPEYTQSVLDPESPLFIPGLETLATGT